MPVPGVNGRLSVGALFHTFSVLVSTMGLLNCQTQLESKSVGGRTFAGGARDPW